jgi:hypothetical protein
MSAVFFALMETCHVHLLNSGKIRLIKRNRRKANDSAIIPVTDLTNK